MVTRVVKKKASYDEAEVEETFEQWCAVKAQAEEFTKRQGTLRTRLIDWVEQFGETDDKGHIRLSLRNTVAGFAGMKYERRVSHRLDEDAAEKILAKKRLLKQCQTTITVLDEAKIELLVFNGKLTDEERAEIFPSSETWAFKPEKA